MPRGIKTSEFWAGIVAIPLALAAALSAGSEGAAYALGAIACVYIWSRTKSKEAK